LLRLLSRLDGASLVFVTATVPSVVLAGALALSGLPIADLTTHEIESDQNRRTSTPEG
jgi:hypothetical protein